jgi:hypothetical protein
MKRLALLAAVACLWGCSLPGTGRAGYIVTLLQQGSNVVATGSGTIDVKALAFSSSGTAVPDILAIHGEITTGSTGINHVDVYSGFTGPSNFGSGIHHSPSTGSGDFVGISDFSGILVVPQGYVSGDPLSDTMTFGNQTLSSLGVTPGTYVWTWGGTGPDADSFTLQIGPATATPEPASLTLLGLGVVGLAGYGWRRKRTA